MFRVSLALCAAAFLALATCVQAQDEPPPGRDIGKYTWRAFRDAGVPPEVAIWIVDMQTEGVEFYPPPNPLPRPLPSSDFHGKHGLPAWNGLLGGVGGIPNDGTAPRGTLLWVKQAKGGEGYSFQMSNGPENLAPPAAPEPQQQVRRYVVPFGTPYGQPLTRPLYQPGCPNGLCPIR